jgi:hypothetical protein
MPGYEDFVNRLTALYGLYPVVDGVSHPADSYLREVLETEPLAAWWVQGLKSRPELYALASLTLTRIGEENRLQAV